MRQMMLTRSEILKEITAGRIRIVPFSDANLGPASYDVTLGDEFRIITAKKPILLTDDADVTAHSKKITAEQYTLKPGESVLGITRERITLPSDICAEVQGRSRFARFGLAVHITASFIQPGVSNRTVLEICNTGPATLILTPGTRIAQIIFARCEGTATYAGAFQSQEAL